MTSSNHGAAAAAAAHRQPLQAASKYASSSSSSSGNESSYYPNHRTQAAAAPSSSVLTQVSQGASSSKAAFMQQANKHKARAAMYRPKWSPELPRHALQHRPLLILDLDETLVHASTQRPPSNNRYDVQFDVDMGPHQAPVPVWVAIRPGAREFLYDVAAHFEIAVFTASIKNYADKVCETLDPQGRFIHHRLYRDHCSDVDGVFVKDLSRLGRPLHRVAILDNSPHAYLFHPENAIPILSWFDDMQDRELPKMTSMLIHRLAQSDNCYETLHNYRQTLQH